MRSRPRSRRWLKPPSAAILPRLERFTRGCAAAARQLHRVESRAGEVMAAMGLCEEVISPLPMVSPRKASQEKILAILKALGVPLAAEVRG